MGLKVLAGYSPSSFDPMLNPEPELRAFPGDDTNLIAAYHFGLSPTPEEPVAGSSDLTGVFSGGQKQTRRGFKFINSDTFNTNIVPGSGLTALTLFAVARRTGVAATGPNPSATAAMCCIGTASNAAFRLDCTASRPSAGNIINATQAAALDGATNVWDMYIFTIDDVGSALYRPRLTLTPVTDPDTIATVGASNLNNTFRAGTAGTAVSWAQMEIMAFGLFAEKFNGAKVAALYDAYEAFALDEYEIELGVST